MVTMFFIALFAAAGADAPMRIKSSHRVLRLDFPPSPAARGFAICDGGVALVPVRGGLAAAGWGGWLREPRDTAIVSAACDEAGRVWIADEKQQLQRIEGAVHRGARTTLARLPEGSYELRPAGDGSLWILVRSPKKTSILRYSEKSGAKVIWEGARNVNAIAALGKRSLLTCGAKSVELWRPGKAPVKLLALHAPCEGVAADAKGNVYVSMAKRIVSVGAKGKATLLADGAGGALFHDGRGLFVISPEFGALFELLPTKR